MTKKSPPQDGMNETADKILAQNPIWAKLTNKLSSRALNALEQFVDPKDKEGELSALIALTEDFGERRDAVEEDIKDEEEARKEDEHETAVEKAREEGVEEGRSEGKNEALETLRKFGGHQDCLFGAVAGQALHPRCTCGWNEVATELEKVQPQLG